MSGVSVSAEDQHQYNALEQQRSTQKGRLIQIQTSALQAKKSKKKAELTLGELEEMSYNNNNQTAPVITYKAAGRMFLQQPVIDVMNELRTAIEHSIAELPTLEKEATYLSTEIVAVEKQMQELVDSHA